MNGLVLLQRNSSRQLEKTVQSQMNKYIGVYTYIYIHLCVLLWLCFNSP